MMDDDLFERADNLRDARKTEPVQRDVPRIDPSTGKPWEVVIDAGEDYSSYEAVAHVLCVEDFQGQFVGVTWGGHDEVTQQAKAIQALGICCLLATFKGTVVAVYTVEEHIDPALNEMETP